jgi:lipopolysaccharide export LptBFGC system permease protein LptF
MAQLASALPAADYATIQSLTGGSASFNQAQVDENVTSNDTANQNNLTSTMNSSGAASDQVYTNSYLLGRNQTISNLANEITTINNASLKGKDTYQRQGEINEWEAQNKLDTLFFFQVMFLFFSAAVLLVYFRQKGTLPSTAVYIILAVLLLIVLGTLWNRASYTSRSRDKRYWNRRFIGLEDAGGLAAKAKCANT